MAAGEDRHPAFAVRVELLDTADRVARFVFDEQQRRNLPGHLQHEFDAHVTGGLNEHRQAADLADGLVVFEHLVEVKLARVAGRQRDDGIGLQLLGVPGVLDGSFGVGSLDANDHRRTQTLVRLDDQLGALDAFVERQELVLARPLRPDDAVDTGLVEELDFFFQLVKGDLVVVRVGRLDNREDALELPQVHGGRRRAAHPAP